MVSRKLALSLCCLVLLVVTTPLIGAGSTENKSMRITFSQPVRLPGVGLGSGTYIFEAPAWDVVQVLSGDRSRVYYQGFTRTIERPRGLSRHQVVSLGESANGSPSPITAWYPDNESTGRQFIYTDGK